MRRVSPFFARRARPAAGLLQQARPGLNLAVQPAGPTPAARKATAPGTELLLLPANLVATTDPSMGKPRLFCRDRQILLAPIKTLANPASPHQSSPRVTTTADASVVGQRPGRTRDDSAAETPETPGPKGRPRKAQRPPEPPRGLPQHNAQQACPTTTSTTPRPCPHEVP